VGSGGGWGLVGERGGRPPAPGEDTGGELEINRRERKVSEGSVREGGKNRLAERT